MMDPWEEDYEEAPVQQAVEEGPGQENIPGAANGADGPATRCGPGCFHAMHHAFMCRCGGRTGDRGDGDGAQGGDRGDDLRGDGRRAGSHRMLANDAVQGGRQDATHNSCATKGQSDCYC